MSYTERAGALLDASNTSAQWVTWGGMLVPTVDGTVSELFIDFAGNSTAGMRPDGSRTYRVRLQTIDNAASPVVLSTVYETTLVPAAGVFRVAVSGLSIPVVAGTTYAVMLAPLDSTASRMAIGNTPTAHLVGVRNGIGHATNIDATAFTRFGSPPHGSAGWVWTPTLVQEPGGSLGVLPLNLNLTLGTNTLDIPTVTYPVDPLDLDLTLGAASVRFQNLFTPPALDLTLDLGSTEWVQTVYAVEPLDLNLTLGLAAANWPNPPMGAPALDLTLDLGSTRVGMATRPGSYPNPDTAPGWTGRIVTENGDVIAELPHVLAAKLTDELNTTQAAAFAVPKYDPTSALLRPPVEVQLFRNDDLMTWGPVIARSAGSGDGALTVQMRDPWWYIMRRFFGSVGRRNLLRNGGFEAAGRWSPRGCTLTRVASPRTEGSWSARLDCPAAGRDAYITQTFVPPAVGGIGGNVNIVHLAAWVWIDPNLWLGPAADAAGLYLGIGGPRARAKTVTIDAGTDRGEWVLLETAMSYSTNDAGAPMTVRLYAPGGRVFWDAAIAARSENTSTGAAGIDQATFASWIVQYAQTGRGKSPVGIGTRVTPTGVIRRRRWDHADHDPIENAIRELVELENGLDWSLDLTTATRTFTTHYPRRGRDFRTGPNALTLRLGRPADGGNIATYSYGEDAAGTSTSVIALGPGNGATRQEGGAMDTSSLGGLVLEHIAKAPEKMEPFELDPWARGILAIVDDTIETLTLTSHPGELDPDGVSRLIHDVRPGDLVRVEVDDGPVQVNAGYRITKREIVSRPETVTFTVSRFGA